MCVPGAHGSQKKELDPLELEQQVVVSNQVGAGNGTGSPVGTASVLKQVSSQPNLYILNKLSITFFSILGLKKPRTRASPDVLLFGDCILTL